MFAVKNILPGVGGEPENSRAGSAKQSINWLRHIANYTSTSKMSDSITKPAQRIVSQLRKGVYNLSRQEQQQKNVCLQKTVGKIQQTVSPLI